VTADTFTVMPMPKPQREGKAGQSVGARERGEKRDLKGEKKDPAMEKKQKVGMFFLSVKILLLIADV